ncbi:MAG: SMC-Scp complex subunit ScpB [Planctomycetota bacterium]|nr:MAG: SMC-Scp complex subunit ScpB [Planctomycetota bacterium]
MLELSSGLPVWTSPLSALPASWWGRGCSRSGVAESDTTNTEGVATRRTAAMARLEAALFVASGPLGSKKLAQFASLPEATHAVELIEQLNGYYDESGCAFRVERLATGYQLLTRPEFERWLDKIHERQARLKLSPPTMETLTIIAYRQPLTRADLESIRGVQSVELLKQLMERGLVKIVGEHDSLGRPYLYGTTRLFLESYGLRSIEDLPMADELRRPSHAIESPLAAVE